MAYVVALNVKRRNLSASQKAIAAGEAWRQAEVEGRVQKQGMKKARVALIRDPRQHFATLFGVQEKWVEAARALVRDDPPAAMLVKSGAATLIEKCRELDLRQGNTSHIAGRGPTAPEFTAVVNLSLKAAIDAVSKNSWVEKLRQSNGPLSTRSFAKPRLSRRTSMERFMGNSESFTLPI